MPVRERRPGAALRRVGAAALLLALGGCQWWYNDVPSPDDLLHAVPWFDAMIRQRSVFPYERDDLPRTTVAGTVPVTGGEADWSAEWARGSTATADRLRNPFTEGRALPSPTGPSVALLPGTVAAKGDSLYQNFCAMCHGPTGAGDGLVGLRMGAPSLLTDRARGYSDGYLYSIVRYGRGVMPRYGDKIFNRNERWAVVSHVRRLQGLATVAPDLPAQPAAPPAPPAPTTAGGNAHD